MFVSILEQKKRREIDPTVEILRECVAASGSSGKREDFATRRMRSLLELLESLGVWYEQMRRLSPDTQRRVLRMGDKLTKIVGEVRPLRRAR
jgi:DNA-binding transcriptional regulator GbsR (MarR family)